MHMRIGWHRHSLLLELNAMVLGRLVYCYSLVLVLVLRKFLQDLLFLKQRMHQKVLMSTVFCLILGGCH